MAWTIRGVPPAFCEVVSDRFDVLGLVYIEFENGGFQGRGVWPFAP